MRADGRWRWIVLRLEFVRLRGNGGGRGLVVIVGLIGVVDVVVYCSLIFYDLPPMPRPRPTKCNA